MRRGLLWLFLLLPLPLLAQDGGRVHIGGYGAIRFEANTLDGQYRTFTFRRLILTTDVAITDRIRFMTELEYERFRKLELEKTVEPSSGVTVEQAVEGTSGSEIAIEQAWLEYAVSDPLRFRAGGLLAPVGRFNIRHDDNLWALPRRSLVDRGVPVLPSKAAWNELGVGLAGMIPVGTRALLSYEAYVINGVALDVEVEQELKSHSGIGYALNEVKVKFEPGTGTFGLDTKQDKALTGRVVFSPLPGQEIAFSGYMGRYTPEYLQSERVQSLGVDGLLTWRNLALEGEFVVTDFGDIRAVATDFARKAVNQKGEAVQGEADELVKVEVKYKLKELAATKKGYWLEARYNFFPAFLQNTFLGQDEDPRFTLAARMEQVWLTDRLSGAAFEGGTLTAFDTEDRLVNRFTVGLTYRPTPLVGFQLAYERTWTDRGKSLGDVTNYLIAGSNENTADAILFGVVFGF